MATKVVAITEAVAVENMARAEAKGAAIIPSLAAGNRFTMN